MYRRIGLFVVAVLTALFGTGLVYAYASSADSRALEGQEPVEVLVAVKTVPAETVAAQAQEDGLLALRQLPRSAVPAGALTDLDAVGGKVTEGTIFPGEVVLAGKFVDPTVTGALSIPGDKLAVSVELTDAGRVAGFVVPGSEVAIFNTHDKPGAPAGTAEKATRLLLPRATVLATGPTSTRGEAATPGDETGEETPVATSVLTLAVDQAGAEKLVHATQTGTVSFALLTTNSQTGQSAGVDNTSLFQ